MSLVRLSFVATLALIGGGLAGCSEKIESPKVGLSQIQPNLVCNSQRLEPDANVVLTGTGFTPMPTNVIVGPSILVLPEVKIAKTQDLAGGPEGGTEIVFPGEPGEPLSNNLVWTSSTEMTVRISEAPAVDLDPGLYDVTVTNPDGDKTFTMPQGLAVVPPPSISGITPIPPAVCVEQGPREIEIAGENFLVVAGTNPTVTVVLGDAPTNLSADNVVTSGCEKIPGTFAGGEVQLCTTITATLPDTLAPGAYSVVVTSPPPASCESIEAPLVLIVPAPGVDDIAPPAICLDQTDQIITVHGHNFARVNVGDNAGAIPTVTITSADGAVSNEYVPTLSACATPEGVDAEFGVEVCDTLEITVPTLDLDPGDYTLTVTNPDPIGCESEDIIALRVNAPPHVTLTQPGTVCTGGSILNITGTDFQAGATVQLRCTAGNVDSIAVDVTSDTTAIATFGPGVTDGDTCEVVFINPDGCEDRPLPHQSVTGTEGPILFNVDPHVAYTVGIDTKVNLYVTAIEGNFTVTMWPDGDPSSPITLDAVLAPGQTKVIQATIPAGTAPSAAGAGYTIQVDDESECLASLADAIRVTDTLVVSTGTVTPPFGPVADSTAITISLGSDPGSTGTPRAFLNPPGTEPAIQLQSVTVTDATTLTAVVPANTPAGVYDLVIVWPDGNVAVLTAAYTSTTAAPPVIDEVAPQSVVSSVTEVITLTGTGFAGSDVTLTCLTLAGTTVTIDPTETVEVCAAGSCTQTATVDAAAAGAGAACVVRVTNDDGTYGDFSAIATSNSSLNLATSPAPGTDLNTARRGLVSAGMRASSAARFVYAIGGDDGAVANALDSAEFAAVDVFGTLNPWVNAAEGLTSPRTFAGITTIGRYMYVIGGNDGAASLATAERAMVLSPEEIPVLANVDLCLSGGSLDCFGVAGLADGLDAGTYSYRVSAVIDPTDPVNLGGETLASDPLILRLRDVNGRKVTVNLEWWAPVDSEGVVLSGITGYRIYRTPMDGVPGSDEVLLAEVAGATTLTYIDDGSVTLQTAAPLPLGSTSAWQALPALATAREGVGAASAMDPVTPDTWHVYALQGHAGGTASAGYEFLTVTMAANGRQTAGAAWTAGTGGDSSVARWSHGVWRLDDSVVPAISTGVTNIFISGGSTGAAAWTNDTEVANVDPAGGGQLTPFVTANSMSPIGGFGPAAVGASDEAILFVFGGIATTGTTTTILGSRTAAPIADPPVLQNWTPQGGSVLGTPRAYMGTALQSANVFLIGGTSTGTNALASTESVVW